MQVVEQIIQRLGLVQHAKKRACDLSGGNKRKLSTAIALVGNPDIIFLVCTYFSRGSVAIKCWFVHSDTHLMAKNNVF